MKTLRADLHVHTCLSPCADKGMSPAGVVREAKEKQLDVIAICDHNSAENVEAACRVAERMDITVIGGMEICSREEVHMLGLFPGEGPLRRMQEAVYDHLSGENDTAYFGDQLVMDEADNVLRHNQRLLIGATDLTLEEIVRMIHEFGGLAIASHVDRSSYSILSQLGFFPPELELDAAEVFSERGEEVPRALPVISSSDAHYPGEIGRKQTSFQVESAVVAEIGMALRGEEGRRIVTD